MVDCSLPCFSIFVPVGVLPVLVGETSEAALLPETSASPNRMSDSSDLQHPSSSCSTEDVTDVTSRVDGLSIEASPCIDLESPSCTAVMASLPLAARRTRRERSSKVKLLTLNDFPVGLSEVLAPRTVGPTWCAVVGHHEGKLHILVPEGVRETLSLIDLQRWMSRSSPERLPADVIRQVQPRQRAPAMETTLSQGETERRAQGRLIRLRSSDAADCPWVGKVRTRSQSTARAPLQSRCSANAQSGGHLAADEGGCRDADTYAAIERRRFQMSRLTRGP